MKAERLETKPHLLIFAARRRWLRDPFLGCLNALSRDRVLSREPGAEINQAAALAAERPEGRALPVEITLARRAFDACRTHRALRRTLPQGQQLSMNVTSFSAWVGRAVMPCQARKRMLQRWWLPLISG